MGGLNHFFFIFMLFKFSVARCKLLNIQANTFSKYEKLDEHLYDINVVKKLSNITGDKQFWSERSIVNLLGF